MCFETMIEDRDTSGLISYVKQMIEDELNHGTDCLAKEFIANSGFKPLDENYGTSNN